MTIDSSPFPDLLIGILIPVAVIIAILIVLFFIFQRRKRKRQNSSSKDDADIELAKERLRSVEETENSLDGHNLTPLAEVFDPAVFAPRSGGGRLTPPQIPELQGQNEYFARRRPSNSTTRSRSRPSSRWQATSQDENENPALNSPTIPPTVSYPIRSIPSVPPVPPIPPARDFCSKSLPTPPRPTVPIGPPPPRRKHTLLKRREVLPSRQTPTPDIESIYESAAAAATREFEIHNPSQPQIPLPQSSEAAAVERDLQRVREEQARIRVERELAIKEIELKQRLRELEKRGKEWI
ncbi:MAG: hypothetical protein M1829_004559 [Trizodia sp. TS-e1964]|nr:MAG: hypothetical protein M1829_004559 [Trizodia sp. TS-e1964]